MQWSALSDVMKNYKMGEKRWVNEVRTNFALFYCTHNIRSPSTDRYIFRPVFYVLWLQFSSCLTIQYIIHIYFIALSIAKSSVYDWNNTSTLMLSSLHATTSFYSKFSTYHRLINHISTEEYVPLTFFSFLFILLLIFALFDLSNKLNHLILFNKIPKLL